MLTNNKITDWPQFLTPSGQTKLHTSLDDIVRKTVDASANDNATAPIRLYIGSVN